MKTSIRKWIKHLESLPSVLCAVCILAAGCAAQKPDPVNGWKSWNGILQPPNEHSRTYAYYFIDPMIVSDYQSFVEKLKKKNPTLYVSDVYFYQDETGRHAVKLVIETDLRDYVEYYLMYDRYNVRTNIIKGQKWHQFHM